VALLEDRARVDHGVGVGVGRGEAGDERAEIREGTVAAGDWVWPIAD